MPHHLIANDWHDATLPWSEDHIQMAIVRELRRRGVTFAADFNAGRRNPGKAKAMGLEAGETDLRLYLPGGRLALVELKNAKGKLSKEQRARHIMLGKLGFEVHVVRAVTPADGVAQVMAIVGAPTTKA